MANKGFYIKSVVAKGELVQDSQINFVMDLLTQVKHLSILL